jgi:hypothetical protein
VFDYQVSAMLRGAGLQPEDAGTQFTCFTGTKILILTQQAVRLLYTGGFFFFEAVRY